LPSQELADKVAEELPPEGTDCILESHQEYPNCPSEAFQDPPTHIAGLDLQAVLMAFVRGLTLQLLRSHGRVRVS